MDGNGACGAFLEAGQMVRIEVGFRLVPAGPQYNMRMDLKSVMIIDETIKTVSSDSTWFNRRLLTSLSMQDMAWAKDKLERAAGLSSNSITKTISIASAGPSGIAIKEKAKVTRRSKNKKRGSMKANEKAAVGDVNMKELPFAQQ